MGSAACSMASPRSSGALWLPPLPQAPQRRSCCKRPLIPAFSHALAYAFR